MHIKKILFVEDDDTLAFIISKKLEHLGFFVTLSKDGKDAITKLKVQNDFDIVISDNILPFFSGIEILKFLRHELNSKTPFVLVSLDSSLYLKETFYKYNGTTFLKKPFIFNTLIEELKAIAPN
jgi:DNA-binding response OmpR family regulator